MSGILAAAQQATGANYQLTIGSAVIGGPTYYGYSNTGFGSLAPTEFLGTNIAFLAWSTANTLTLQLTTAHANSGWTSININGTVFSRSSASFGSPPGNWQWTGVTTNPIGASIGAIIPVNIS